MLEVSLVASKDVDLDSIVEGTHSEEYTGRCCPVDS